MAGAGTRRELTGALLREVSRSFYLTLRVLPGSIRDQIGTAYLLARATDTIADTGAVPVGQRLAALRELAGRIAGEASASVRLGNLADGQSSAAERTLLLRIEDALGLLAGFGTEDRREIQRVLATIVSGQELDLIRFAGAGEGRIVALGEPADLDDYAFRVAGCVGDFWTRICLAHLSPQPRLPADELAGQGIRFGKGLQLVNILRDLPADLRQGRCYLPESQLAAAGLRPADLLLSQNEPQARAVYNRWLDLAEEHLAVGWQYVLALPRSWLRLRLACAWPVLIGMETAERLRRENVLDGAKRIKVGRREVKRIVRRSVLALPFKRKWETLGARNAEKVNRVACG